MRLTNPVPIRFTEEQRRSLREVAETCGLSETDVIRMAIQALVDHYRHHGNRLVLPLRFTETSRVHSLGNPKQMNK